MHRIVAVAVLTSSLALAQDAGAPAAAVPPPPPPSAEQLKAVLDYYFNGKDRGPALVELKACLKVDSTSKDQITKNECLEPVTGPVKKGTTVHAWTMWYLPLEGSYDNVSIQFVFEGQVRSTIDLKLNTAGRSRTWRSSSLAKAGKWQIKVIDGTKELGMTSVTVVE